MRSGGALCLRKLLPGLGPNPGRLTNMKPFQLIALQSYSGDQAFEGCGQLGLRRVSACCCQACAETKNAEADCRSVA